MKKFISLFLAAALTAQISMCGFSVFADNTYLIKQEEKSITFAQNATKTPLTVTEVKGVFGRAEDDVSALYTRNVTQGNTLGNSYVNTTLTDIDQAKDLIIESSFIPGKNVKNLCLGTSQNASVGAAAVSSSAFNPNEWNKFKAVINLKTNNAVIYLNGKKHAEFTYTGLTNNIFRFIFNGSDTSQPISVYMDYFCVYQAESGTQTGEETMPLSESGTNYTLSSNKLTLTEDFTVSGLKGALGIESTVSLRVYQNSSCQTQLAQNDLLTDGCVAVLQTSDNLFQYLTIDANDGMDIVYSNDGSEQTLSTPPQYSVSNGLNGKPADDKVLDYQRTQTSTYLRPPVTFDTSKIIIVQMQFMPGADITSFTLGSTKNAAINSNFNINSSDFNLNSWNNLKAVIDIQNSQATLYINNKKFESQGAISFVPSDGLRFIFASSSSVEIYFDSVKAYQSAKTYAEVNYGFTYPIGADKTEYTYNTLENTIDFGEYKTLSQIKEILNLDKNTSVRAYTADFQAELTDTDTLNAKNLLVIEKPTGEIQTVAVASHIPQDKPVTLYANDGSKKANGTTSETVTGAKGRVSDDQSIKVLKSATSGIVWYGTPTDALSLSKTAKDLVFEFSFVPPEDLNTLLLAHNQNADIGVGTIPSSAFVSDAWNKVKLVWNLSTNKSEVFINGKIYKNDINMISVIPTQLRVVCSHNSQSTTPCMYLDDFHVYINDIGFESDEESYLLNESGSDYIINHDTMTYIGSPITVSAFSNTFKDDNTEIRVYSANYASLLKDTDVLSNGCRIVIAAPKNIITTYTFKEIEKNKIYLKGEGCYSDTRFISKNIEAEVLTDSPAVLLVSQFNEKGEITDIKQQSINSAGRFKLNYTPKDSKGKLKFMLLNSLQNMIPLCDKTELEYLQSMSVLIIGNSFSTDSLKYLREIAEADGVEINVGRLIKGGSDLSHHYQTRETAENVNTFYYNGVSQGYTNLKNVLAAYDWDYVAIQNWSSEYYENLSDSFWTVADDIVKYINEKEPKAEILINKTWSFEKGYSYGSTEITAEVQKNTDNYLKQKTEMISKSAGKAIGKDSLRIVPAGDAFTAARNYTNPNGVHIFDTTYHKDSHSFTSEQNRQTIDVGQGILSEAEKNAGYIRLHRDGFHSSLLARYMLAAVWYEALTGKSVVGNTFVPASDSLDSGAVVMDESGSLVVYFKFDSPPQERIDLVQEIVHEMMQNNSDWNK